MYMHDKSIREISAKYCYDIPSLEFVQSVIIIKITP